MDNMTMHGALRMLRTERNEYPSYYPPHASRDLRASYDSIRIAVDISCLAQLVQSLVLHENIIVDQAWSQSWQYHADYKEKSHLAMRDLRGVTLECALPLNVRTSTMLSATDALDRIVASEGFTNYVTALLESSIDGAYIKMTDEYHKLGFADPTIFDPGETVPPLTPDEIGAWESYHSGRKVDPSTEKVALFVELEKLEQSLMRVREIGWERERSLVSSAFGRAMMNRAPGQWNVAIYPLLKNIHAAIYYQRLADSMDIAYLPHPLRTAFVAYDSMNDGFSLAYVGERFAEDLANIRARKVEALNRLLGQHTVAVRIPLFLATVLERAQGPSNIIDEVLNLRNSPPAIRFRRWSRELQDMARAVEISELSDLLSEVQRSAPKWFKDDGDASGSHLTGIELNLGIVTITRAVSTAGLLPRSHGRHLRLFQSLAEVSNSILDLAPKLAKVFGEPVAKSYREYSTALDRLMTGIG
ncbi:hypothetical protein [Paractinoplanes ferrugineus]|uniref:hypothetical protein n=1 Tax=Paractinoplanes ferrugineus TaxID=113564 RepID=UPI001944B8FE|nr:hypothetical protein [Actinoplanes ferrugineus]